MKTRFTWKVALLLLRTVDLLHLKELVIIGRLDTVFLALLELKVDSSYIQLLYTQPTGFQNPDYPATIGGTRLQWNFAEFVAGNDLGTPVGGMCMWLALYPVLLDLNILLTF